MIKLLRVDHRLLHGQVAMAWTQSLDSDCILIANDAVVNDNIRKTTIKLAKPNGVKLVMKNIEDSIAALNAGVTDKYKLFIVVESIEDAYRLVPKDMQEYALSILVVVSQGKTLLRQFIRQFQLLPGMRKC